MTRAAESERYWDRRGAALLWTSVIAGPLAWALDLNVGYASVQWSCSLQTRALLFGLSAVTALVAAGGAWAGRVALGRVHGEERREDIRQGTQPPPTESGGRAVDRSRFMAIWGIGFSLFFLLVVLAAAIPRVVLSPCE